MYDAARIALAHARAFLLVVNDQPGELLDYMGGPNGETVDLPVASISGTEGAAVIARASRPGRPEARPQRLAQLPLGLRPGGRPPGRRSGPPHLRAQAVRARQGGRALLRGPHPRGLEFRWSFRPQTQYGIGFPMYADFPAVRTDWVSTQPGTRWVQNVAVLDGNWDLRADLTTYRRGQHVVDRWMSPVVLPAPGTRLLGARRQGDYLVLNLPSFGGRRAGSHRSDGHPADRTDRPTVHGPTLVKEAIGWQDLFAEVDAGPPQVPSHQRRTAQRRRLGHVHQDPLGVRVLEPAREHRRSRRRSCRSCR